MTSTYYRFGRGVTPVGSIVIRLYHSGDKVRGFIRELAEDEDDDSIYPTEELAPEIAFRLANNRRTIPQQPLYVELMEGVTWDHAWGRLD